MGQENKHRTEERKAERDTVDREMMRKGKEDEEREERGCREREEERMERGKRTEDEREMKRPARQDRAGNSRGRQQTIEGLRAPRG